MFSWKEFKTDVKSKFGKIRNDPNVVLGFWFTLFIVGFISIVFAVIHHIERNERTVVMDVSIVHHDEWRGIYTVQGKIRSVDPPISFIDIESGDEYFVYSKDPAIGLLPSKSSVSLACHPVWRTSVAGTLEKCAVIKIFYIPEAP